MSILRNTLSRRLSSVASHHISLSRQNISHSFQLVWSDLVWSEETLLDREYISPDVTWPARLTLGAGARPRLEMSWEGAEGTLEGGESWTRWGMWASGHIPHRMRRSYFKLEPKPSSLWEYQTYISLLSVRTYHTVNCLEIINSN